MSPPVVAVIDLGSNSIKGLAVQRESDGRLTSRWFRTLEVRISAGINQAHPRLSDSAMDAGLAAVQTLVQDAQAFAPAAVVIVATSAVRDAVNGAEFRNRIEQSTGYSVRILTGAEEADLIGVGLLTDPALETLQDFYVFDLGGGSLECLAFRQRRVTHAVSLPLGCVRLTERHVADRTQPFNHAEESAVRETVKDTLAKSGFNFDLGPKPAAVFTGGTLTTARAAIAGDRGETPPIGTSRITVSDLRKLFAKIAPLTLDERKTFPGIPAARADVFPAAITTVLTLAEEGMIEAFEHSHYNLRWGLAAEAMRNVR